MMKSPIPFLFTCLFSLLGLAEGSFAQTLTPASKPNILFILTDDQRWNTLGCMGDTTIQTPHIDKLAKEGVLFRNNFVTTSICCCSRASIFTGQYTRRHGIEDFATKFTDGQWTDSYPSLLRQNGYWTGFIGKFGVGTEVIKTYSDRFDYFKGVEGQGGKYFINPKDPTRTHETTIFGDDAVEFLANAPTNKPFCLSVSFTAPHARDHMPHLEQYQPDDRDLPLYKETPFAEPLTATDEFFHKLPLFVQTSLSHTRWLWRFDTQDHYEISSKNYYRLITGIDREVGRMMDELDKRGLTKNTIIIYTSDNGYFLGDRKLSDKFYMYEESLRVPLIIVDPRQPTSQQGRSVSAMTLNIDLAPTMLSMAGIPAPSGMQGQSMLPLLQNQHPEGWRQQFFYEEHYLPEEIPPSEGVRTERWSYIRWINANPVVEELFDLQSDPLEAHNQAANPAQSSTLKELRNQWDRYRKTLGEGAVQHAKPNKQGEGENG